jgi:hypothetical protein
MRSSFNKSGMVGFAVGLAVAAGGSQAAAQVTQHEQPTPSAQQPAPDAMSGMDKMKDMDAMMADPAMRQKMMADMAHCRDMMSMMMEHMKHEGKMGDAEPAPHKH